MSSIHDLENDEYYDLYRDFVSAQMQYASAKDDMHIVLDSIRSEIRDADFLTDDQRSDLVSDLDGIEKDVNRENIAKAASDLSYLLGEIQASLISSQL